MEELSARIDRVDTLSRRKGECLWFVHYSNVGMSGVIAAFKPDVARTAEELLNRQAVLVFDEHDTGVRHLAAIRHVEQNRPDA
ncbi:MAG: hypothetical protein C4521_00755 [Actinobacteria bacterium]|nr:MAG: hypothetical protein C4521_00755 [Actinomycetota bacterium]